MPQKMTLMRKDMHIQIPLCVRSHVGFGVSFWEGCFGLGVGFLLLLDVYIYLFFLTSKGLIKYQNLVIIVVISVS